MPDLTLEQQNVLASNAKNIVISASAGSGKTFILIKYITTLILEKNVPLKRMLVLTFTRAAAGEMRERLNKALLDQKRKDDYVLEQIDDLSIADISTIDAFCEKLIRRNIDKLEQDENFKLVENPDILKKSAFEKGLEDLGNDNPQMLDEIYYSYRKNKDVIFQLILQLEDFFTYQEPDFCDQLLTSQPQLFDQALHFLNEKLKKDRSELIELIENDFDHFVFEPKYQQQCLALKNALSLSLTENFIENVHNLRLLSLPETPRISGEHRDENLSEEIKLLRAKCKAFVDDLAKYNFDDEVLLEKQKSGSLCTALLTLYKKYAQHYALLKQKLDVLDFVDIESLALKLLEDENILNQLQEKYDYIFVDEYQDTNKIQEKIVKPLVADGHFIAVGDPKQGIYGFRNATMEIMQGDIEKFSNDENGQALYLKGNFRSDGRILEFVNKIFVKLMTPESVGIDYESTSKLTGQIDFVKPDFPSVRVDIIKPNPKPQRKNDALVYSVKDDALETDESDNAEIDTTLARIDSLLMQKIYDAKSKEFRPVRFDDIAILMRSRRQLMSELSAKLSEKGIPYSADVKQCPASEPEVQMLVNLLQLMIDKNNDIALISVMSSQLGGFSLDELASMRIDFKDEKTFYEVFNRCHDQSKVVEFDTMLDNLKLCAQIKGISAALRELFAQKNYYAYLKLEGQNKYLSVCNFLQDIASHDYDFDLAGAISYFNDIGGSEKNNNHGSGIKLMTIHASKGLEFPIVILAGAGEKLEKTNRGNVELNEDFGLCTSAINPFNNTKCTTPNLEAAKILNKRKEMIDEIMIFYVALTRAQNHLYIVGQTKPEGLICEGRFDFKNYLSATVNSFGKTFAQTLIEDGKANVGDWEFNIIDDAEQIQFLPNVPARLKIGEGDKIALKKFFEFEYDGRNNCEINLKSSVTSLNQAREIEHEGGGHGESVDTGNAYHEAMKILNFENIFDIPSLNSEIEKNKEKFTRNYLSLIDRHLLLKNILVVKKLVGRGKLFKEKPFVLKEKICNVANINSNEEILVQGIVDLFAFGEKNILIDYKFTGQTNPAIVIERYSTQLNLYRLAIEAAFGVKVDKKYILSMKTADIIEF